MTCITRVKVRVHNSQVRLYVIVSGVKFVYEKVTFDLIKDIIMGNGIRYRYKRLLPKKNMINYYYFFSLTR